MAHSSSSVGLDTDSTKKRKRQNRPDTKRKAAKHDEQDVIDELQDTISDLEAEISSITNANPNVAKLLYTLTKDDASMQIRLAAAVALCKIFYRFIAGGSLDKSKTTTSVEKEALDKLKEQKTDYVNSLCGILELADEQTQGTVMTLLMTIVKAEVSQSESKSTQAWREGAFLRLMTTLARGSEDLDRVREIFVESYVERYDDIRFYTFLTIGRLMVEDRHFFAIGSLDLLLRIEGIPSSATELEDWYGARPSQSSLSLLSFNVHKKLAQDTWLLIFKASLKKDSKKRILDVFIDRIAPWFTRPETLMDFLTDSYNEGGATSLLALSGVYYLIKERNLDYPQFYTKLYSLLDDNILHSKHRTKFFRLLDTFLSSTHLPAILVASFIKRLSRLALHASPGGIVMVVPWVYNMMKRHPQCTFMLHREIRDENVKKQIESNGMEDQFDMAELDPMQTKAIDSCLWELLSLQSHYHPNVATLAKIISAQFTKQEYNLEDFLDHSYNGLIEAELGKDIKKAPVVEFEIPKRIVTKDEGGLNEFGSILQQALEVA